MTEELTISDEMGVSHERAEELVREWLLPDPTALYSTPADMLLSIAKADLTLNEKLLLVLYAGRLIR